MDFLIFTLLGLIILVRDLFEDEVWNTSLPKMEILDLCTL
jgi:hypothetical protein